MFFVTCQAERMGRERFHDSEIDSCNRPAKSLRQGYALCATCAEALDAVMAFAERVLHGSVDGTVAMEEDCHEPQP